MDFWPVAEFIDPWLGDKVNSGIGLLYRGTPGYMAGGLQQPYAGVDFIPQSGICEFGYRYNIPWIKSNCLFAEALSFSITLTPTGSFFPQ